MRSSYLGRHIHGIGINLEKGVLILICESKNHLGKGKYITHSVE